jgi:Putative quorum-sensing-regulated virulence factor
MIIKAEVHPGKTSSRKRKKRQPSRRSQFGSFPLATGKYAGRKLRSVPRDYLRWLLDYGHPSEADRWAISQFFGKQKGANK